MPSFTTADPHSLFRQAHLHPITPWNQFEPPQQSQPPKHRPKALSFISSLKKKVSQQVLGASGDAEGLSSPPITPFGSVSVARSPPPRKVKARSRRPESLLNPPSTRSNFSSTYSLALPTERSRAYPSSSSSTCFPPSTTPSITSPSLSRNHSLRSPSPCSPSFMDDHVSSLPPCSHRTPSLTNHAVFPPTPTSLVHPPISPPPSASLSSRTQNWLTTQTAASLQSHAKHTRASQASNDDQSDVSGASGRAQAGDSDDEATMRALFLLEEDDDTPYADETSYYPPTSHSPRQHTPLENDHRLAPQPYTSAPYSRSHYPLPPIPDHSPPSSFASAGHSLVHPQNHSNQCIHPACQNFAPCHTAQQPLNATLELLVGLASLQLLQTRASPLPLPAPADTSISQLTSLVTAMQASLPPLAPHYAHITPISQSAAGEGVYQIPSESQSLRSSLPPSTYLYGSSINTAPLQNLQQSHGPALYPNSPTTTTSPSALVHQYQ